MKKSVILMAGLLAMALAGSAQAATMFAVQDATATDKMTVSDAGWIGVNTNAPVTPFHAILTGSTYPSAGFTYSWTNTTSKKAFIAPNFTFTRNNDTALNASGLPVANDKLGELNFGTVANGGTLYKSVQISAYSEEAQTGTSMASYLVFATTNSGAVINTEKVRITSTGNVGIGTAAPTAKLQVVGLVAYNDNDAAKLAGLTAGAFYLCGPAAVTPASQHLCVVY